MEAKRPSRFASVSPISSSFRYRGIKCKYTINRINYQKPIVKNGNVIDKYRRWGTPNETIEYIMGICSMLAGMDYLERHYTLAIA